MSGGDLRTAARLGGQVPWGRRVAATGWGVGGALAVPSDTAAAAPRCPSPAMAGHPLRYWLDGHVVGPLVSCIGGPGGRSGQAAGAGEQCSVGRTPTKATRPLPPLRSPCWKRLGRRWLRPRYGVFLGGQSGGARGDCARASRRPRLTPLLAPHNPPPPRPPSERLARMRSAPSTTAATTKSRRCSLCAFALCPQGLGPLYLAQARWPLKVPH